MSISGIHNSEVLSLILCVGGVNAQQSITYIIFRGGFGFKAAALLYPDSMNCSV